MIGRPKMMETAGIDRLAALHLGIELVRRGGTLSLSGVYGGAASPMPLLDDLLPLLADGDDPLGVDTYASHHMALDDAPHAYEIFQKKQDGAFKVVLNP